LSGELISLRIAVNDLFAGCADLAEDSRFWIRRADAHNVPSLDKIDRRFRESTVVRHSKEDGSGNDQLWADIGGPFISHERR
jgi:hypothetical protein